MVRTRHLVLAAALATGLAACGSSGASGPPPLSQPPVAASAPPLTATPAGRVIDLHVHQPEGIAFDASRRSLIIDARPRLALEVGADGTEIRRYPLAGMGRHVRLAGDVALIPLEDASALALLDLASGTVRDVPVGGAPHDVTPLPGGRALVASEATGVATVVDIATGRVAQTLACGLQPATTVIASDLAACIDVRGQRLYRYATPAGSRADGDGMLAVGPGPTHVVDIGGGLVAVADALGSQITLVDLSHLKVVGHVALAGSPEGLAADLGRHRLWVTLPGSNTLVEIDLSGHGGRIAATYPTVQQANSDAVDPQTGTVYVAGRTDAGTLQILRP